MNMQLAGVIGVNLVHLCIREGDKLKPDREYFEILKEAGFDIIVFPIESASQRILDKYATKKLNHRLLDVFELIQTAADVGIRCPVNMMLGFPDETEEEMMASVEMGKKAVEAGAEYCTPFVQIPFPGCDLYNLGFEKGYLPKRFNPDIFNYKNAVMINTLVPPERIMELRDYAHDYMNTSEHKSKRLSESAVHRWQD